MKTGMARTSNVRLCIAVIGRNIDHILELEGQVDDDDDNDNDNDEMN